MGHPRFLTIAVRESSNPLYLVMDIFSRNDRGLGDHPIESSAHASKL